MIQSKLKDKTVLVVDDDPAFLHLMISLLRRFNCQVLVALNSLEALALYDQHREAIAMAFVDIMMPDINGIDFIQILRLRNPDVPIVVVSGVADKARFADKVGLQSVRAWLQKPIRTSEIEQVINQIFSAPAAHTSVDLPAQQKDPDGGSVQAKLKTFRKQGDK